VLCEFVHELGIRRHSRYIPAVRHDMENRHQWRAFSQKQAPTDCFRSTFGGDAVSPALLPM
jgi:hypothetical protein